MAYVVKGGDPNEVVLHEQERIANILQNVRMILATRKGSVPHFRDYGVSWEYVDRPINVAKAMLCASAKEAVEAFEPRVTVVGVSAEADENNPGRLIPIVEVEINDEQQE